MQTDKQLFQIFQAQPEWVFELTQLPSPGPCKFESLTFKSLERRCDGVLVPESLAEPIWVIEFQMSHDVAIYNRVVIEMALAQESFGEVSTGRLRPVRGLVIFLDAGQDPKTPPWIDIIDSFVLGDRLNDFSVRHSDHPMVAVFQPLVETDLSKLEKNARVYYNQIAKSGLGDRSRAQLADVFVSWLEQRFANLGKLEIETMLLGDLPDLRDTQSGKDLIQIGRMEGKLEGKQEGILDGERKLLVVVLEAKFGTIPDEVRDRILNCNDVELLQKLAAQSVTAQKLADLQW